MNYFQDIPVGNLVEGVENQDLQALAYEDASFDIVVAMDVLEQIPYPDLAVKEIARVLNDRGMAFLTFPVRNDVSTPILPLALLRPDGEIEYLCEPEYHGNPFDGNGSLVFNHFGYDIHAWLADMTGLDVHAIRFADHTRGILGPLTEVFVLGRGM